MKRDRIVESGAVFASVVGLLGAVAGPFYHEAQSVRENVPAETQVITLTGVAEAGVWTDEEVRGGNYWNRSFRPAEPVLQVGTPVLLRLKSADVVHRFYSPGLGIEPVEVYPGHVVEILFTPHQEGDFGYYCTTICGKTHFAMRGAIHVEGQAGRQPSPRNVPVRGDEYWRKPEPPPGASAVERGKWLFEQKGCETCHGPNGQGGVSNLNYVDGTVPALDTLAETMFLYFPEDIEAVVAALEDGVPLETLEEDPPVRRFGAVLAQYQSVKDVIRNGNPSGQKDPNGPYPPLEMPAWRYLLSESDIDSVIAYLLTRQLEPQDENVVAEVAE